MLTTRQCHSDRFEVEEVELSQRDQAKDKTYYAAPSGQSHCTQAGGILEVELRVLFDCIHVKFGLENGRI